MYYDLGRTLSPQCLAYCLHTARQLGADRPVAASMMTPDELTRPHLDMVAMAIPPPWIWVTFVSIASSQQIVAHTDPPLARGLRRYHIPIQTNDNCWVFSNGTWQQLKEGQVYRMNPAEPHGAVNWGAETRIHLLVDRQED